MTARTGIIALVDRDWSDQLKAEANLLVRVATQMETVWVNPRRNWRDAVGGPSRSAGMNHPPGAGRMAVYTPPSWLTQFYRPAFAERFFFGLMLRSIRRHLVRQGCDRIVLYLWNPKFAEALDLVAHDASIYHIVDEYSFSDEDPPTTPEERSLIQRVDHVIVHSPALLEKKGGINPNTSLIPNGVDFGAFGDPCEEPADLASIPHPRVGYCGYVKRQLDWDLLGELIRRRPDVHWIFVGTVRRHHDGLAEAFDALAPLPNVHFLGTKPTRTLARYPQHFDVCIMPYRIDGYTRYIFPLKLHEYLAAGTPTIGTPIRTLKDFEGVIELALGADEWSAALERSMQPEQSTPEAASARRAVARQYDWDILAEQLIELIRSS